MSGTAAIPALVRVKRIWTCTLHLGIMRKEFMIDLDLMFFCLLGLSNGPEMVFEVDVAFVRCVFSRVRVRCSRFVLYTCGILVFVVLSTKKPRSRSSHRRGSPDRFESCCSNMLLQFHEFARRPGNVGKPKRNRIFHFAREHGCLYNAQPALKTSILALQE